MHHVIVLLWFPEIIFFSLCVSNDFLNIDKMLRCAIAIKLNGETLRQVRTLYTHNADSHLKITQSVYFTH